MLSTVVWEGIVAFVLEVFRSDGVVLKAWMVKIMGREVCTTIKSGCLRCKQVTVRQIVRNCNFKVDHIDCFHCLFRMDCFS